MFCLHLGKIRGRGIMFSGCMAVRLLSTNTYFTLRNISVLSGWISMKLGKNIRHVSGRHRKSFQGQRSKVKVITRLSAVMAEAWISMVRG